MTQEAEKLNKEKNQLFNDVYNNTIPKRVPIRFGLQNNVFAEYIGINSAEGLWNPSLLLDAALELAARIPTDTNIYYGMNLSPNYLQAWDSTSKKMSRDGTVQYLNVPSLFAEDYEAFIKNAYDCIIERAIPRLYTGLDFYKDPGRAMIAMSIGKDAKVRHLMEDSAVARAVKEKFGGWEPPADVQTSIIAPFDYLGDNLWTLKAIVGDIRRIPEKVDAALESLYPLNYFAGIPFRITNDSFTHYNFHQPTFMRDKDFQRFYWKHFLRQTNDYASLGIHTSIFLEHNWMNRLDYLLDLPVNTRLNFEVCDPMPVKEKLGSKFILSGGFPLETLRLYSREECIARVKDFLDIMMPGGNYLFGFDKSPFGIGDANLDKLQAVCETVRDYGVYKNAGEKTGMEFHKEDYKHSEYVPFTSKYYRTWEQTKELYPLTPESAKKEVMDMEKTMVKFIYDLVR